MKMKSFIDVPAHRGFHRGAFIKSSTLKKMTWPVNAVPLLLVVVLMAVVIVSFCLCIIVIMLCRRPRHHYRDEEENALQCKFWEGSLKKSN